MATSRMRMRGVRANLGAMAMAGLVGMAYGCGGGPTEPADPGPGAARSTAVGRATPEELGSDASLAEIAAGLREGDGRALAILAGRLAPKSPDSAEPEVIEEGLTPEEAVAELPGWLDDGPRAIPSEEAEDWLAVLDGLGHGYRKFSPYGRASASGALATILDRFAVEPAPEGWRGAIVPAQTVFAAGLADPDASVRFAALRELARFWTWAPGAMLDTKAVDLIASVKSHLYDQAAASLQAKEGPVRGAAVACLAALPLDPKAAPAVGLLDDPDVKVRLGVLQGFADRPKVLTDEALLPLMNDPTPVVATTAEAVLRRRGLSPSLIGLGKLAFHPRPEVRASAVAMALDRTDTDPVSWLVLLSNDADASVRLKAAEALADRDAPRARARLAAMAASDASPEVRAVAVAAVPPGTPAATAALPPLPGSAKLNPSAN